MRVIRPDTDPGFYYNSVYHTLRHRLLLEDDEYFYARAEAAARLYFGKMKRPLGKILEYGCGAGQNIATIEDAVGYDVSAEAVEACKRRKIGTIASAREIPRDYFDIVFCRHVLEHLEHPLHVLRDLFGYCKRDGLVVLVLPKEKHRRVDCAPDENQHLYCWNFRCINNLIHRAEGTVLSNGYAHVVGYHTLLPLRRILGKWVYFYMTQLAGWVYSVSELVIHAKPGRERVAE